MNSIFEPVLGLDKDTFLTMLSEMYEKNPRVLNLIELFELEFECKALGEKLTTKEIIKILKDMNKKYKNEIPDVSYEKTPFAKLEVKGDNIEGYFEGSVMVDFKDGKGAKQIFQLRTKNGMLYLPTNFELSKKLNVLEDSNYKGDIYIERGETERIEGGKQLAKFKVFTE